MFAFRKRTVVFLLSLFLSLLWQTANALTLDVGETYTCDIGYVSNLQGCQWTSSDYSAIDFVGSVSTYSTSVTVQALSKPSYATPVTIHCKYYYLDLDPVTRRYTYLRSGYKDWQFFIHDNGPTGISVNPSSLSLNIGDTYSLRATVTPSTADQSVDWSSSNYSVVYVNAYGQVEARGAGEAWITATTSNGLSDDCYISVANPTPTGITISSTSLSLAMGETRQLSYTLSPQGAYATVTWRSSDTGVASVSSSGLVTARSEGTAQITVSASNGLQASCSVSVYKPLPTRISLSQTSLKLSVGTEQRLSYTVTPSNAVYTVSWYSDAPAIASVNSFGTVTAIASGTARITVSTDNGCSAQCSVNVPPLPTTISLNHSSLKLGLNQSRKLRLTFSPSNAEAEIAWSSQDDNIVSVAHDGTLTARSPGQTTITATTQNGVSASCVVTVPMPAYSLILWQQDTQMGGITQTQFSFDDEPQVKFDETTFYVTSMTNDVQCAAESVLKFTLEDSNAVPNPPTAIEKSHIDSPKPRWYNNTLTLTGTQAHENILVVNAAGVIVAHAVADTDGRLSVSLQSLPSGIYIVKTKSTTFKIVKK